jgi:Spy/CpxP family protein refolding chaperone
MTFYRTLEGSVVMNRCRCSLVMFAAAVLIAAGSATAQPPQLQPRGQGSRWGGESPNDPTYMLFSESVQKELALTDDQKGLVEKLREEEEKTGSSFFRRFMRMSPDEIQQKLDDRAKAARKKLAKILTPEQLDRLNQINIQVAGITALSYEDVAAKLKLTAGQKDKLQALGDESRQELADLFPANSAGPPDAAKMREIRPKQAEIKAEQKLNALAVLTDEQKSAFEKLQGEKFDTSTIQPLRRSYINRGRIQTPPGGPRPGA